MQRHLSLTLFAFLALLCAAAPGCGTTSNMVLRSDPVTAEMILAGSKDHGATIVFASGQMISGYAVAIQKDSTRWRSGKAAAELAVPTNSVYEVEIDDPHTFWGILAGLLLGAVAGTAVGIGIAFLSSSGCFTVLLAIGLGGIGGILGAIGGAATGGITGASNKTVWIREGVKAAPYNAGRWDPEKARWIEANDTLHSLDTMHSRLPH